MTSTTLSSPPMTAPRKPAMAADVDDLQSNVVQALQQVVPKHALLWHVEDTTPFECDGLTAYRQRPLVVALPS